jgi:hypothetical protein
MRESTGGIRIHSPQSPAEPWGVSTIGKAFLKGCSPPSGDHWFVPTIDAGECLLLRSSISPS